MINFIAAMMSCWYELEGLAFDNCCNEDCDALIWQYTSIGLLHTLYNVISLGGVLSISIPSVLQLHIPPRIHILLWLLAHNRVMIAIFQETKYAHTRGMCFSDLESGSSSFLLHCC
jgi:hypothetical protein